MPYVKLGQFGPFVAREPLYGLGGLGAVPTPCSWWEWPLGYSQCLARERGVTIEGDTSDFSAEEIRRYIEATPPGGIARFSSEERSTTTTTEAPAPEGPSRLNWLMYGAFGVLALGAFVMLRR